MKEPTIHLTALIIVLVVALIFAAIYLAVKSYFWLYDRAKGRSLKNALTFFYVFLGAAFIYLYVFLGMYYSD